MKKFLITLSIVISFVSSSFPLQAAQFTDLVDIADDLKSAVTLLANANVIRGYEDGTFRPNVSISEQEWVRLLQRAKGISEQVNGYRNTPVIRIAAIRLLANVWDVQVPSSQVASSFIDIAEIDKKLLGYFQYNHVLRGRGLDQFSPLGDLTRAEAAKILLLAANLTFSHNNLFDTTVEDSVTVSQNVIQIVDVSPRTLAPSGSGSLLFTVNNHGDAWEGLVYNTDYIVSVLSGGVNIISSQELGNGLYQVFFRAPSYVPAGPINIQVTLLHAGNYKTDINEFLRGQQTAQVSATTISLAQLLPSSISNGEEAQILVTPRDSRGRSVSGLEIAAEVSKGGGNIVSPVVESPLGSGIYIGTYRARGQSGDRIEIIVRINNLASRPQTTIYGNIR